MPVVAGGVVDQDGGRAERGLQAGEGALELVDVAQVAGLKADFGTLPPQLLGERPTTLLVEVDEPDPRALGGEGADDLLADARMRRR